MNCIESGYGRKFFSTHFFRSGIVCEMLMRLLIRGVDFSSVFDRSRILGGWVEKSTSFPRYIKKSMLGSIIASRFVEPNKKKKVIEMNLIHPINFHGLNSLSPKWKSDSSYSYGKLIEMCFEKLFMNLSNLCSLSEICKSICKSVFTCSASNNTAPWCYLVNKFCETY